MAMTPLLNQMSVVGLVSIPGKWEQRFVDRGWQVLHVHTSRT